LNQEFVEIQLLNSDKMTILDLDDFEKFGQVAWRIGSRGYAAKNQYLGDGKWETSLLHRKVMNAPKGVLVDHINGNKLDNRKSNLRFANHAENARNNRARKISDAGYKGVYISGNNFRARIRYNNNLINLGTFSSKEDAARMYNFWAKDLFGEFARINVIKEANA
jgi:hypothetical protein